MTNRHRIVALTLGLALILGPVLIAHGGHAHKIMGTVTTIHENHLEVKDKDGKSVTVTLNEKTKIQRGKETASKSDIKVGERIVVMYISEAKTKTFVAKEVRLTAAKVTATK